MRLIALLTLGLVWWSPASAQVPDLSDIRPTATGVISVQGAAGATNCINNYSGGGAQDYKICLGDESLRFPAKDLQTCNAVDPQLVQNLQRHYEAFMAEMHGVINVAQDWDFTCEEGWP